MAEIVLADSFRDIHPSADIMARGIKLLGVDVENVLTDYGNPEVLPGVAENMEELLVAAGGISIVLITNKKSSTFLDEVVSQLPGRIGYVNPNKELGLKKKPSPRMFRHALHEMFTDIKPSESAHVDDQFKAWWGATLAGFGTFFWTKPVGEHQHAGVQALRPVEMGILRPAISATINIREIIAGDW